MFIDWPLAIMALSSAIIGCDAADSAGVEVTDDLAGAGPVLDEVSGMLKRRLDDGAGRGATGMAGTAPRGEGGMFSADGRWGAVRDIGGSISNGVMLQVSRVAGVGVPRRPSVDRRTVKTPQRPPRIPW